MIKIGQRQSDCEFHTPISFGRLAMASLLFSGLAFSLSGCTNALVDTISVTPTSQSVVVGGTVQLTATGTIGHGSNHPSSTEDVTDTVTWSSSSTAVATVSATGVVRGVGAGTATITASMPGFTGNVSATASVTVTASGTGVGSSGAEPLLSINIVPASTTVSNKGMTGQYLAFGTFSTAPTLMDITNGFSHAGFPASCTASCPTVPVTWVSLLPEVASINSGGTSGEEAGLATAQGYTGNSVIYAEATNPDTTVVLSNPQTFTCKDPTANVCIQTVAHPQFSTLTIYVEGENTTPVGEYVTAPSDTGTANLIHCGPDYTGTDGQVCTGTYETGSTVIVTENLQPLSTYFGGWSSGDGAAGVGCQPAAGYTLANSPTCTVTLSGDTSVGIIFY